MTSEALRGAVPNGTQVERLDVDYAAQDMDRCADSPGCCRLPKEHPAVQLFECRLPKERASVRHVAQQAAATHRLGQRCMSACPEHGEEKPILLLPVRDRLVNLHIKDEELLVLGIINRWSLVCLLFKFCATLSICKGNRSEILQEISERSSCLFY